MTPSQLAAVSAEGNVLLEAGAGSGKTSTLVQRCIHQLLDARDPISLDQILMVTFTEAAASEMRHRIRQRLDELLADAPNDHRLAEQLALLDQSHIGTLHSFCFRLVREHFYELGIDPQSRILDENEAQLLANETVADVLDQHYSKTDDTSKRVRQFIQRHGEGDDTSISSLIISTHHFLETLPNREAWLKREHQRWKSFDLGAAEAGLVVGVRNRCDAWLELLEAQDAENTVAANCARRVHELSETQSREECARLLAQIAGYQSDDHWPRGTKTKFQTPILPFLREADFYSTLAQPEEGGNDPLAEDFERMQPHMVALLDLIEEFSAQFSLRKRQQTAMDFSDLEQFSLKLLLDPNSGEPSEVAREWQGKIRQVYVDEYQDINEAQDRIIALLSRSGEAANRFLVGDVKQSIYGFRLARPDIFLRYAATWRDDSQKNNQVLPLSDNFRSHESIVQFVNATFKKLLHEPIGGIRYGEESHLRFGDPEGREQFSRSHDPEPRVELICRLTAKKKIAENSSEENAGEEEEFTNAEKEAQMLLGRLRELRESGHLIFDRDSREFRPVDWRDMVILLRATSQKAEIYSRIFNRAGVPLTASRRGFFDAIEISDMVSLLTLLDNPLQDIPLLAVLRSPIVGLGPDELVAIRVMARREPYFWTALQRYHETESDRDDTSPPDSMVSKLTRFLAGYERWRTSARRGSLSQCLEDVLETTRYLPWLSAQPNGSAAVENVQRLLQLVRQYDSWHARGLHRFLEYVRIVQKNGDGPEPAAATHENAIQLMTIHASKGLEFPVVALADLGKIFHHDRPTAGVLIDETIGICPVIFDEDGGRSYPSLQLKQAEIEVRERALAEELRLLYVAMTRACDRLILAGTTTTKRAATQWHPTDKGSPGRQNVLSAKSLLDFIGPLLPSLCGTTEWFEVEAGKSDGLTWRVTQPDEEPKPVPRSVNPPIASEPTTGFDRASLRERIEFSYPFLDATRRYGKTTVTRLRKQFETETDDESASLFGDSGTGAVPRYQSSHPQNNNGLDAAQVGIAYHTFFQKIKLSETGSKAQIEAELRRLTNQHHLTAEESRAIDVSRIFDFWKGKVGAAFLKNAGQLRRELAFTAAFTLAELSSLAGTTSSEVSANDVVIVQGIADLVLIQPNELWILDFKSDRVSPGNMDERIATYRPQVQLYQRALERICRKPVTRLWLHFLHPGRSVEINLSKSPM